jgi:hypothetical protein
MQPVITRIKQKSKRPLPKEIALLMLQNFIRFSRWKNYKSESQDAATS